MLHSAPTARSGQAHCSESRSNIDTDRISASSNRLISWICSVCCAVPPTQAADPTFQCCFLASFTRHERKIRKPSRRRKLGALVLLITEMGANSSQFCPAACCEINEEERRSLRKSRLNSRHPKSVLTTTAENDRRNLDVGSRSDIRVLQSKSEDEKMQLHYSSHAHQPEGRGSPMDCRLPYSHAPLDTAPPVAVFGSPPSAYIIPGTSRTDGEVRRKHSPWVEQFLGSSRDAALLRYANGGTPSSPPLAPCQGANRAASRTKAVRLLPSSRTHASCSPLFAFILPKPPPIHLA